MQNSKSRGRPIDPQKVTTQKVKLLTAAQKLLNLHSYSQITIRDIAAEAEVNSAMIKYYFNNKEGLFIALLNQISNEKITQLNVSATEEKPVLVFIQHFITLLRQNSGLHKLLSEEVLNNESQLSEAFLRQFPSRVSQFLPRLIQKETGIKNEQQAKLAAFHLCASIISPFLLHTVRLKAWQISDDVLASEQWPQYIYQHFLFGFREKIQHEMEPST